MNANSGMYGPIPLDVYNGGDIAVYDPHNRLGLTQKYPNAQAFRGPPRPLKWWSPPEMNSSLLSYMSGGGRVVYAGQGSGPIQAVNNWDYNRFSFAYLPQSDNALTKSLQKSGLRRTPVSGSGHPVASGRFRHPRGQSDREIRHHRGQHRLLSGEYSIGEGILLQTTLRLDSEGFVLGGGLLTHESLSAPAQENVLGTYLLDQMVRYLYEK